ncbi:MAG: ABC transporter permease [Nitrospirae bacterium]|nr:ABC transporter permease [Candidatus Troglogloeales bacterium]MBI3598333.1 ABC transporter permease [Candidatus Troglogloeales bacterium]
MFIKPVFLWTDIVIVLLSVSIIFSIFYGLRKAPLGATARQIVKRPMAMAAGVILLCYLLVGLLDSFHFRLKDQPELLSVLDILLTPLRMHGEKTYSAPLAKVGYTKETVEDSTGAKSRIYPPLLYGGSHLLGTDKVGQDVLYLSLKAIRTGLVVGTLTTLIMLPFAVLLGISAGYFKGWVDDLIQYLYTTLSSVPGVLLIAATVLILQVYMDTHADDFKSSAERADVKLFFLCLILGTTGWIGLCRLLRGETLKISELEYVQAASALGVSHGKIITRHILPNVMHIILISAVLDFSGLVLTEAILSYVGIGVDPSMISWGNMINSARLEMAREPIVWWSLLAAFVMMFGLVLSANIFSDAVRDALDPRLRGKSL